MALASTGIVPFFGALVLLYILRHVFTWTRRTGLPLPPGPPPLPLVGNLFSMDNSKPWETYTEWGKTYGPIMYSRLLNKDIIIINSEKIAKDLMVRRSANFSDRPLLITNVLFGQDWNAAFMHYGDRWRQCRRLLHQAFRPEAALAYRPVQMQKTHGFLLNMMESPEDYPDHLRTLASSAMMAVTYSYESAPQHDSLVATIDNALKVAVEVMTPEAAAILNAFPSLIRLPSWFPGAGFQKKAQYTRDESKKMVELPFQYVKKSMAEDALAPSLCSDLLNRIKDEDTDQREQLVKEVAASAYIAAAETTASAMATFFLAMIQNPQVQAKAQSEIDTIVGHNRLPTFDDRPILPYIDAVLRETLRWHPVAPLGIAHAVSNDDIYEGYHLPKGATVIANTWAMSHDESIYSNPFSFEPDRFLSEGRLTDDNASYVFGFGRRICVGRYAADASLWSAIVSFLAVFSIKKAVDERGNEVDFEAQWTKGLTTHPQQFPCRIEPRKPSMDLEKLTRMIDLSG